MALHMYCTAGSEISLHKMTTKSSVGFTCALKRHASEEETTNNSAKEQKKCKLPMPQSVKDMFEKSPSEVGKSHDGRKRSFPHQVNCYATFVSFAYSAPEAFPDFLEECADYARDAVGAKLIPLSEFHISLTRCVPIKHHWISAIAESLKKKLATARSFTCTFGPLKVFVNDEKTRTFLALEIVDSSKALPDLVRSCDDCFSEFDLPKFYEEPTFHVSIAWCLGDVSKKFDTDDLQFFKELFDKHREENDWQDGFRVEKLVLKCGDRIMDLPLGGAASLGKKIA